VTVGCPADKNTLRQQLLDRRRHLPPDVIAGAGVALADAVGPLLTGTGPVALYASTGTEPPTGPLLDALHGRRVLLPVLRDDGDLDWAVWEGTLVPGRRGTQQPPGPGVGPLAVATCDVVVVPALAVDRQGVRLGRGGGAYDRALPRARGTVVALLHDGELVERLPAEPHDVPVGAAATPSAGLVSLPGTLLP
jgi:5-formyltetrahydrofolate cyclo-ligase